MIERRRVDGGNAWAEAGAYSRAVRVGDTIWVAGTTAATADGVVLGVGDPYEQAREAISAIAHALAELGAGLDDVVSTRMYVTDISRSADVLRAHGEVFATARPATAMVEVAALIDPRMLVEIEAVAVAQG